MLLLNNGSATFAMLALASVIRDRADMGLGRPSIGEQATRADFR